MHPPSPYLAGIPSGATVLCIEDHPGASEPLRFQLQRFDPRWRVLEAGTGGDGLALNRAHEPEVVLLDLTLPDGEGLELIGPLRAGRHLPAIMVYTARNDDKSLRAMEAAGIAGILWKGTDIGAEMGAAVQRVLDGEVHVSRYFSTRLDGSKFVPVPRTTGPARRRERIVVADGDRLRADGIARAAREACPQAEVIVCHSAAEAMATLRAAPASLGLIGLTLPDRDGIDLLGDIEREHGCDRVLIIAGRDDERTRQGLRAAWRAGIFDCGGESPHAMVGAIRQVAAGGTYFSVRAPGPVSGAAGTPATVAQLLTDTELQVFAVVGDGSDDAQATVHNHRQRIMRKLGVQSRTDLMREAMRRGVVRFTATGRVLTPGLERVLAERASRSHDPFGAGGKGRKS